MSNPKRKQPTEQARLISLALLFILPFTLVVYQLISEINVQIDFASRERLGIEYNYKLRELLQSVIELVDLSNSSVGTQNYVNPSKFSDLEAKLAEFEKTDQKIGKILKTNNLANLQRLKEKDLFFFY
ncbi:MAG: hypothetical protein N3E45_09510 [Oscillatoriaceae bacterium SKW80]|nr:hypothetical protein [Oscillatoriaceae bacterium SKW80]HIK26658.1 hypothetical protein [Oscillatoriaceae cyanobacterium M7585_C2015_266]